MVINFNGNNQYDKYLTLGVYDGLEAFSDLNTIFLSMVHGTLWNGKKSVLFGY